MSILIDTTTVQYPTKNSNQRKIIRTSSGNLVLFSRKEGDVAIDVKYKVSSDNGKTWGSWIDAVDSASTWDVSDFDIYLDSNDDILLVWWTVTGNVTRFRKLINDGNDTWTNGNIHTFGNGTIHPVITRSSSGDIYVATRHPFFMWGWVFKSTNEGANWTQVLYDDNYKYDNSADIIAQSTNIWVFGRNGNELLIHKYDGSSWSIQIIDNTLPSSDGVVSVLKVSDSEIYVTTNSASGIKLYKYDGSSWDSGTLMSDNANDTQPVLSLIGTSLYLIWRDYDGSNYNIYYRKNVLGSWEDENKITNDATNDSYPSAIENNSACLYLMWSNGDSSPYNIMFFREISGLSLLDTITLSDEITINLNLEKALLSDTVNLSDEILLEPALLSDTVNLSDEILIGTLSYYASAIIYKSPYLYIVTDSDPAKIIKVTIGTTPSFDSYELTPGSGQIFKNAKDIKINNTTNKIYVTAIDGQVMEISLSDLSNQTQIDTNDLNDLQKIAIFEALNYIYMNTNDSDGEIILLDNNTINIINTDFRFLLQQTYKIVTILNFIQGIKINTDFRFLLRQTSNINTDFRFRTTSGVEPITPIGIPDFHIYINNVEVNDFDSTSLNISYDINNEECTASFVLARYHDKPNYTINGVSSQITNQNKVEIKLKTYTIFDGKIENLRMLGSEERISVNVTANTKTVNLQTPTGNVAKFWTQIRNYFIHKYNAEQVQVQYDATPEYYTTLRNNYSNFYRASINNAKKSLSTISLDLPLSLTTARKSVYDVIMDDIEINNPSINANDKNPREYLGVKVNLGFIEMERGWISGTPPSAPFGGLFGGQAGGGNMPLQLGLDDYLLNSLADWINLGLWQPDPNFTYFWNFVSARKYWTDANNIDYLSKFTNKYIGESLSSLTSDAWIVDDIHYIKQRIEDNWVFPALGWVGLSNPVRSRKVWRTGDNNNPMMIRGQTDELGNPISPFGLKANIYYTLGSAPYKEISSRNGAYIPQFFYVDREDGLYKERREGYDFIEYAKQIAAIEFAKMKNINGDILPKVYSEITLTYDALLYYNIGLLSKINIINTTESGIYKNQNGFPLSIKTITINTDSGVVSLNINNEQSNIELDVLDSQAPEERDFLIPAFSFKEKDKFNPNTLTDVE